MITDIESQLALWQFDTILSFNPQTHLVINKNTNRLMIKKIMPEEAFGLHSRLSRLQNKNIAEIYDVIKNRHQCIILEQYIAGKTIQQLCDKKTFSEEAVKDIVFQLCNGLEALHEHNIVHRDLTPSNVMISDDGIVKIIDFGISRFEKDTSSRDTKILGTEGFAAPEQFGFKQSTAQTDIYALGVLINFMLTGHPISEVKYSGKMSEIIEKCTEIDTEKRYKSVSEIKNIFTKGKNTSGNIADKVIDSIPGFRTSNKKTRILAAVGYAFLIMFCITGYKNYCFNIWDGIYMTVLLIFLIFLPIIIFSNFLSFWDKIPFLKNSKKSTKSFIFNILGTVCIIIGLIMNSNLP